MSKQEVSLGLKSPSNWIVEQPKYIFTEILWEHSRRAKNGSREILVSGQTEE
jgi:hypothetical protein